MSELNEFYAREVIPGEECETHKIWADTEQLAKQSVLRCGTAHNMHAEHLYWRYSGNNRGRATGTSHRNNSAAGMLRVPIAIWAPCVTTT